MAELQAPEGLWDELIAPDGSPRPGAGPLVEFLRDADEGDLRARQALAEVDIRSMGITFTVYSEGTNIDRAWPFDIIPRVIDADTWRRIDAGLRQRVTALNRFIDDVYGDGACIADGVIPAEIVTGSAGYREACRGVRPAHGVWAHVCGSDLVRDGDGTVYVLEDNLRVPSGVSYMIENRLLAKRALSEVFERMSILPVDDYPDALLATLESLSAVEDPTVVVLTPGVFNSAYFEHSFLARRMGAELVEGADLFVEGDRVHMRTIDGPRPVDVIYRRIDDLFLDPEVFRDDSVIGVPGLMRAWRAGNVAVANAPGSGVADDKVVYCWVPDLIRYYTGEEPILPNVPTWRCAVPEERRHVLDHLGELVIKPANEAGGYGLVVGDRATRSQLTAVRRAIEADPRSWVAQPILRLSVTPTLCPEGLRPRHVDLRPFILSGDRVHITPGGLTRVALRAGSLVVNSSQGGGSKDTWVVESEPGTAGTTP